MGISGIERVMNRVLFCTSPLQVVNARSAMDYLGEREQYRDYIVMIHQDLLENTKKQIKIIGRDLGYDDVIDLSDLAKELSDKKKTYNLIEKLFKFKSLIKENITNHKMLENKVSIILKNEIGDIDILFYRINYKYIDSIFIYSQKRAMRYGVEDGIGDYIPKHWHFFSLNFYEIKHSLISTITAWALFVCSLVFTWNYKACRKVFLKPVCNFQQSFKNIETADSICVKNSYLRNIAKLSIRSRESRNKRIVIIGSLIPDTRFQLDLAKEVRIYNSMIEIISKKHEVNREDIWYKHHPRLSYESWEHKKKNMNCSLYAYEDRHLIDTEFQSDNIVAVYSVGSTALLYAKVLYDIPSYLIDITNESCHPSVYAKAKYLARKFNIPICAA